MDSMNKEIVTAHEIRVVSDTGDVRLVLNGGSEDKCAHMAVFTKSKERCLLLAAQPDDSVEIAIRGRGGVPACEIRISKDDHLSVVLTGPHGDPQAIILGEDKERTVRSSIAFFENGKKIYQLPPEEEGD